MVEAATIAPPLGARSTLGIDTLVWGVGLALLALFGLLLAEMFAAGLPVLSLEFITGEASDAGRSGGISAVLVSTLWVVALAVGIALPLALGTALYISEYLGRGSTLYRLIHGSLDVLSAVPSVVFGLFGNAVFCELLGLGYSLAAGALTLVCMIVPVMVKASVDGLTAVPTELRAAGSALALSKPALIGHIVLPAALPGVASGVLLGVARALAETAALLFTSGYVLRMPDSPLDSGRTLSIHIYDLAMNVAGGDRFAYGSATVLVILLLMINGAIALVSSYAHRRTTDS